jgi:hypothetical protein
MTGFERALEAGAVLHAGLVGAQHAGAAVDGEDRRFHLSRAWMRHASL